MKKILLSWVVLFSFTNLFSQNDFEILIPLAADTSVVGLTFQESIDGSFFVEGNIEGFYSGSGVLIDGNYSLGTALIKISETGIIDWIEEYQTNSIFGPTLQTQGKTPSRSFLQLSDEKIILPYSIYSGFQTCEPNIANFSYKKSSLLINAATGEVEMNNNFLLDSICANDKIIDIKKLNENHFLLLHEDDQFDSVYLETINQELEIVDHLGMPKFSTKLFFDKYSDNFISATDSTCNLYNYTGMLTTQINFPKNISIYGKSIKVISNQDLIVILVSGITNHPDGASSVTILSRQGDIIAQKSFSDLLIKDIAFHNNDQLLMVENKRGFDYYDSMTTPLRVKLFDLELKLLAENDYGLPFVNPHEIKVVDNNSFAVLGTRLKSIDVINGKEEDQIYFLKKPISDLLPVGILSFDNVEKNTLVYPNPTTSNITVDFSYERNNDLNFILFDNLGRKLLETEIPKSVNEKNISIESFEKGVYFFQLRNSNGKTISIGKVIKI